MMIANHYCNYKNNCKSFFYSCYECNLYDKFEKIIDTGVAPENVLMPQFLSNAARFTIGFIDKYNKK